MIVIVDYGLGNTGSVLNMVHKMGGEARISSSPDEIKEASAIILPGVGAFDNAMQKLDESGLIPILEEMVINRKVPFLGICLGMQLLFERSEEGKLPGLGWIEGEVKRFRFSDEKIMTHKIPHMGWNQIQAIPSSPLFSGLEEGSRFYFVHSYHVVCDNVYVTAHSNYGYPFICSVNKNNIYAAQFHPEKSHKFGKLFFKNFIEITKC